MIAKRAKSPRKLIDIEETFLDNDSSDFPGEHLLASQSCSQTILCIFFWFILHLRKIELYRNVIYFLLEKLSILEVGVSSHVFAVPTILSKVPSKETYPPTEFFGFRTGTCQRPENECESQSPRHFSSQYPCFRCAKDLKSSSCVICNTCLN